MPLAPYSDGILSGSYAPPGVLSPAPLSATPLASATSGAAVNASGALVSFLPPVTDWFTPSAQKTSAPTVGQSPHPCQGEGGGECGCGGTCKKGATQTMKPNNSGQRPVLTKADKQKMDEALGKARSKMSEEEWNSQVLKTEPGNSTIHAVATPAGDYLVSVAAVNELRDITLNVREMRSNGSVIDAYLKWGGTGWALTLVGHPNVVGNIPRGVSLDGLALLALTSAISVRNATSKYSALSTTPDPCHCVGAPNSNESDCIPHDLVCTGSTSYFTSDHKHLQFWAPCVGSYEADIGNCCLDHDINLWCAHNILDVNDANSGVISCVQTTVIAAAWTALAQMDLFFLWAGLCAILIALWQLTYTLAGALFTALGTLIYDGLVIPLTDAPCFFNYDHSHDDSCLCGGTKPTTQCQPCYDENGYYIKFGDYGACDDICKIAGTSKNETGCYNCAWKCNYDSVTGKLLPPKFDDNGDPSKCCPGTSQSCNPTQPNCPECEQCCWFCHGVPDSGNRKHSTTWGLWQNGGPRANPKWNPPPCCLPLPPVPPLPCDGGRVVC